MAGQASTLEPKTAWLSERRGEKEQGGNREGGRSSVSGKGTAQGQERQSRKATQNRPCAHPALADTARELEHPMTIIQSSQGLTGGEAGAGGEDSFLEGKRKGFTASARAPWTRDVSQKDSLELYLSNKTTVAYATCTAIIFYS